MLKTWCNWEALFGKRQETSHSTRRTIAMKSPLVYTCDKSCIGERDKIACKRALRVLQDSWSTFERTAVTPSCFLPYDSPVKQGLKKAKIRNTDKRHKNTFHDQPDSSCALAKARRLGRVFVLVHVRFRAHSFARAWILNFFMTCKLSIETSVYLFIWHFACAFRTDKISCDSAEC